MLSAPYSAPPLVSGVGLLSGVDVSLMRINHQSIYLFHPRYTGFRRGFNHVPAIAKPAKGFWWKTIRFRRI